MGLFSCTDVMDYMEDNAIPAGDPVTHGPTATLTGSDGPDTRNFQNVLNAGEHDVWPMAAGAGSWKCPMVTPLRASSWTPRGTTPTAMVGL